MAMQIRNPIEWAWDHLKQTGHAMETTAHAVEGAWEGRDAVTPMVRRIHAADIGDALARGVKDFGACRTDVITGMFASNVIMYFVILTTAATLHAHGYTNIATAQQAAEALRPVAGAGAYWLFTLGLIGTGMLAVPVLAGSCAYAIAEAAAWRGSLNRRPRQAKKFYIVLAVSMALGIALNYAGLNAIKLLFTTAVINGVLAPPLILIVLLLTGDRTVMGDAVNSRTVACLGWLAFVVMVAAALGLFIAS